MKVRMGLTDTKLLGELRRPMELDLEAAFGAMQEAVIKALIAADRAGLPPHQAIEAVQKVIGG